MCPRCPDEPLLDLRHEETWSFLEHADTRARYRRFGQMVALCLPIAIVVTLPLIYFGFIFAPVIAAALGAALASFLARKFPPRPIRPSISRDEWALIVASR
jgi:hypothetical protein